MALVQKTMKAHQYLLTFVAPSIFVLTTEHTERSSLTSTTQPATPSILHTRPTKKMRRYNLVSGVLFILPIINFALAAPAQVQEKRHAFVDVVHRPGDVLTVLGKRGDALDLLWDKYFDKLWGKPEVSSATHAPSSSAPSAPGHGSTDVIQEPGPNSASSTANPGHALVGPTSPSSSFSTIPEGEEIEHAWSDDHWNEPPPSLTSSEAGLDHEITEVHSPQSTTKLNPSPSTNPGPDSDWNYWLYKEDIPSRPGPSNPSNAEPSTKSGFDWKYWINPLNFMSPLTPEATKEALSKSNPSTKSDFNWDWWHNLEDKPPPQSRASSKLSNTKPSTRPFSGWNSFMKNWKNPLAKPSKSGQSNPGTSSTKLAPKIPPSNIATQSSGADLPGADSQPLDPQAAAYASKSKAKALRRISGASGDVENVDQREIRPAGRPHESA